MPFVSVEVMRASLARRARSSGPRSELAVVVLDGVLDAEDLAERPDADLAAVGIDGDGRLRPRGEHEDAHRRVATVRHLVRSVRALGEADEVALLQLVLALGIAQRRPAGEHGQPLLLGMLVVVRADALAGIEV